MAKRIQQESGEERVTPKSRLMMNLTARMPSVVSSSISSSLEKTWYEYQDPGKSVVVDDRSGKPDRLSPAGDSKSDYDLSWSSQEWKSEVTAHDRSGKPDETSWNAVQLICPHHEDTLLDGNAQSVSYGEILHDGSGQLDSANSQEEADSETFVVGSDAAEFVNQVKDQVRKRQQRMSNVVDSGEEHSIIWGVFMAATMNEATFIGKNFLDDQNSIGDSTGLTLKKMFDISEKLVSEQEEMNNVDRIYWKNHSWKQLSLIGDETVINLQRAKVYVFSSSVLCLGRIHQHPESNEAWKKRIEWIITDKSYRDFDGIIGEPTEFEWNIFPGFTTLQLCGKVTDLLSRSGEAPETFTGRILLCLCSTTFLVTVKAMKKNVWQMPKSSPYLQRILVLDSGHLLVQVLKRSAILWKRIAHKEFGIISRKRCWWNSQKADILFSVQRLHCLLKSKGHGKLSIHFTADYPTIETIFRIIVLASQLSLYGAVANMCEEFQTHQDRSGQLDVLMGQSIVLSENKAEVPLDNDIPSHQNLLLQRYERDARRSHHCEHRRDADTAH